MSETDSENDYESADDEENTKGLSCSPTKETTPSERAVLKLEEPELINSSEVSVSVCEIPLSDETEATEKIASSSLNRQNESDSNMAKPTPSTVVDASLGDEAKTTEEVTFGSSKNQDDSDSKITKLGAAGDLQTDPNLGDEVRKQAIKDNLENNGNTESDLSESHPKRVTLRLEKKMQQKAQIKMDSVEEPPKPQEKEETSSWGFGSWGSSLLSSAASSVSTFTSQVSQGIGTVLETVENSLGAPPPEDLAAILRERRDSENPAGDSKNSTEKSDIPSGGEKENKDDEEDISTTSSLFTGVSSLKSVIENTGTKVLMGGLDTLELIGKKTIDILTEGDPGLRKKRSAFSQGINLSQLLREAKDKAEEEQSLEDKQEDTVHFSSFFDEFQGLVHLEALEMLSSQCQNKVQSAFIMTSSEDNVKEDLENVKRICQDLPSADDASDDRTQNFEECLNQHIKNLQLQVDLLKIKDVSKTVHDWLDKCLVEQDSGQAKDPKELYSHAIKSLAEFTARSVEHFHKFGELLLVNADPDFSVLVSATHLTGLTTVLCIEVGIIATKFCQCLNTAADGSEDPDLVTPLITNVYLEASNSTTYIQDAFQLLVPVLQTVLLQ